jgi:hypothetical protein
VHMEIGGQRHAVRLLARRWPQPASRLAPVKLQSAAVGFVVEGVASVSGVVAIGGGVYLVMRGAFPEWLSDRFLWPLVRVTRGVARLQGLGVVVLGASILAIVITTITPATVGGGLVLGAIAAYLVALGLFLFSTWLSRRPAG